MGSVNLRTSESFQTVKDIIYVYFSFFLSTPKVILRRTKIEGSHKNALRRGIGVRKPEAPIGFELETLEYKGGDVSRYAAEKLRELLYLMNLKQS